MTLFDLPQAEHFCRPLQQATPGVGQSLTTLHSRVRTLRRLGEGSREFEVHRVSLLHAVERWLLYALSNYRRSVEMAVPVSAPWMHVTLYYASFFAAQAILGMFGGWIGSAPGAKLIVEVHVGTPGSQEVNVRRWKSSPNGRRATHAAFWDYFYDAAASIAPWIPGTLAAALDPVNGDRAWLTSQRNDVNYDTFVAWEASMLLQNTFQPQQFPHQLMGPLGQQFETTEQLVDLAATLARLLSIQSFALDGCGVNGTRLEIQRHLVCQPAPTLANQSALERLLGGIDA